MAHLTRLRYLTNLVAYLGLATAAKADPKVCAYVDSYHRGYEWSDRVYSSLKDSLGDVCHIKTFYLDAKNHPDDASGRKKGDEVYAELLKLKPDIIVACDDPASAFVIKPYFKDVATPVVFCGVNWSGDDYGYPYSNATGMVEVFPVKPLAEAIKEVVPGVREGTYLGVNTITDRKTGEHVAKIYASYGLKLHVVIANNRAEWERAFKEAQNKQFVLLTAVVGLSNLDLKTASAFVAANAKVFIVGFLDFSLPLYMFAMTEIAEEQGEHAGRVAAKILAGAKPGDFPIIPNARWNMYANAELLRKARITLPSHYMRKAQKIKN